MLTYHHIQERRNGGQATVENGALLSLENHSWFNKQSEERQKAMNKAFQEYKATANVAILQGANIKEAKEIAIDMTDCIHIPLENDNAKYNRARVKRETQEQIEEYYQSL